MKEIKMILTRGFLFAFGQFIGNISKKDSNQNKGNGYLSNSIGSPKIIHLSSLLSHQIVVSRNSIPRIIMINYFRKN